MAFMKMLWASGSPIPLLGSWDYWTSVAGYIFNFQSITIQKVYPIIAYYAIVHSNNSYTTIMISTEQNAVVYKDGWDNRFYSRGTITDTNNITWYWSGFERGGQPIDMSLVLNDTEYEWSLAGGAQAAQDLLDRIYAVPFHEDYQVGQMYNVSTIFHGDVLKTLRKTIGIALFLNVSQYGVSTSYTAFSDNIDSIISTLMSLIGTDTFVGISLSGTASSNDIELRVGHPYKYSTNFSIREKSSRNSFEYYVGLQNFAATVDDVVTVSSSGVIQYTRPTPPRNYPTTIGFNVYSNVINSTNMGIDL